MKRRATEDPVSDTPTGGAEKARGGGDRRARAAKKQNKGGSVTSSSKSSSSSRAPPTQRVELTPVPLSPGNSSGLITPKSENFSQDSEVGGSRSLYDEDPLLFSATSGHDFLNISSDSFVASFLNNHQDHSSSTDAGASSFPSAPSFSLASSFSGFNHQPHVSSISPYHNRRTHSEPTSLSHAHQRLLDPAEHIPSSATYAERVVFHCPRSLHSRQEAWLFFPESPTTFILVIQEREDDPATRNYNLLDPKACPYSCEMVRHLSQENRASWQVELVKETEVYLTYTPDPHHPVLFVSLVDKTCVPVKTPCVAKSLLNYLPLRDVYTVKLYASDHTSFIELSCVLLPEKLEVKVKGDTNSQRQILSVDATALSILMGVWSGMSLGKIKFGDQQKTIKDVVKVLVEAQDWQGLRLLSLFTHFPNIHVSYLKTYTFPDTVKEVVPVIKKLAWSFPVGHIDDVRVQKFIDKSDKVQLIRELWGQFQELRRHTVGVFDASGGPAGHIQS